MNSPIYFLSALLITYSFGPEETFVVHISDASNIDIILDTISSDVSTLSIFQTTIFSFHFFNRWQRLSLMENSLICSG